MTKPLFVGEMNPYGADHEYALYPYPENSAGGRLCKRVLELEPREYLRRFARANLCEGRWSMRAAQRRVDEILGHHDAPTAVVMLGSKVSRAFGFEFRPFAQCTAQGKTWVVLPHPSGLNRMWNEPGAYERARETLRQAKVL